MRASLRAKIGNPQHPTEEVKAQKYRYTLMSVASRLVLAFYIFVDRGHNSSIPC